MNGKVVLITGASSGIGEQLSYQYAKKGAFLALFARRRRACKRLGRGLVRSARRTCLFFGRRCQSRRVHAVRGAGSGTLWETACSGGRYVTEPSWFGWLLLYKVFAPELLEWFYRIMLVTEPGTSQRDATTKKILDAIGAKKYLYPDTIQSSEVKRD
ncbi:hypothetical protein MRB53_027495 [Persea americana]|uniref:Uncharacterized protein n=1 Tax=Persea americana TaxID=3435 RepID=A0ACC2LL53_PERAE|nr:hypothetical protein MRB53_027495 [Persea americana]